MTAPLDIKKYREIAESAQLDLAAGKTIWTDNLINYYHMTRPETVLRLLDTIEQQHKNLTSAANQIKIYQATLERYEAALKHIKNGCLVPPDGGQPNLQDAIDTAREALRADAPRENRP